MNTRRASLCWARRNESAVKLNGWFYFYQEKTSMANTRLALIENRVELRAWKYIKSDPCHSFLNTVHVTLRQALLNTILFPLPRQVKTTLQAEPFLTVHKAKRAKRGFVRRVSSNVIYCVWSHDLKSIGHFGIQPKIPACISWNLRTNEQNSILSVLYNFRKRKQAREVYKILQSSFPGMSISFYFNPGISGCCFGNLTMFKFSGNFRKCTNCRLRWLKTVSSTFQDLDFDGPL